MADGSKGGGCWRFSYVLRTPWNLRTLVLEWGEGSRVFRCMESLGSTGVAKGAAPWPVGGSSKHGF